MIDRCKYILTGLFPAAVLGIPCYVDKYNLSFGLLVCLVVAVAIGLMRFFFCIGNNKPWSWKAFCWNCLGVAIVAVFIVLMHIGKG